MALALKELEPFVRDGEHLQTGKRFKQFGNMLSREMWANWLVCAAASKAKGAELTFSSDPTGGDGVIQETVTGETWLTEHVTVPKLRPGQNETLENLILKAVAQKCCKGGKAYAEGKTLVVFLNASTDKSDAGVWYPNRIARQLPDPLHFTAVLVVALQTVENGEYIYTVTNLDVSDGDAPVQIVRIGKSFDSWAVTSLQ